MYCVRDYCIHMYNIMCFNNYLFNGQFSDTLQQFRQTVILNQPDYIVPENHT